MRKSLNGRKELLTLFSGINYKNFRVCSNHKRRNNISQK